MADLGKRKPEQVALLKALLEAVPDVSISDAVVISGLSDVTVKRVRREMGLSRTPGKPEPEMPVRNRFNLLLMRRWERGLVFG